MKNRTSGNRTTGNRTKRGPPVIWYLFNLKTLNSEKVFFQCTPVQLTNHNTALTLPSWGWGPGNHARSTPGVIPLFLDPKLHKEMYFGVKTINYRPPSLLVTFAKTY